MRDRPSADLLSKDGVHQSIRRRAAAASLAVLSLVFGTGAAPALPGVGADDRRVAVDAGQPPWLGVGRVQTEVGGRCTGFLIGTKSVITAGHCLYSPATGQPLRPRAIHFVIGYDRGAYAGHSIAASYRLGAGYDPARERETMGADWALVTLEQPLGGPGRVLSVDPMGAEPGESLALGGYGQDRAEALFADLDCRLVSRGTDLAGRALVGHSCAGTRGTSGAPLLSHRGGAWRVVGIQVAGSAGRSEGFAIPSSAWISAVMGAP